MGGKDICDEGVIEEIGGHGEELEIVLSHVDFAHVHKKLRSAVDDNSNHHGTDNREHYGESAADELELAIATKDARLYLSCSEERAASMLRTFASIEAGVLRAPHPQRLRRRRGEQAECPRRRVPRSFARARR